MSTTAPTAASGPAPLGDRTAAMLLATFQDAYRQEISAEEDVHRTLPFFATALGLVIAAVNYALGQLPGWDVLVTSCPRGRGIFLNHHMIACIWPVLLATACLLVSAVLGMAVLGIGVLADLPRPCQCDSVCVQAQERQFSLIAIVSRRSPNLCFPLGQANADKPYLQATSIRAAIANWRLLHGQQPAAWPCPGLGRPAWQSARSRASRTAPCPRRGSNGRRLLLAPARRGLAKPAAGRLLAGPDRRQLEQGQHLRRSRAGMPVQRPARYP